MMNMRNKNKSTIFMLKIFFVFLFLISIIFNGKILAFTEDLGPSLRETQRRGGKWYLSYYGGTLVNGVPSSLAAMNQKTNQKFTYKDFTINEEYGWYEYNYNGVNCVVLAGATRERLNESGKSQNQYRHYFIFGNEENNYKYDVINFKFGNWAKNDTIFTGIILDTTDETMNPPESKNNAKAQKLSAYILPLKNKKDYDKSDDTGLNEFKENNYKKYDDIKSKGKVYNGKEIYVSDDGTFPEDVKGDTIGTFILNFFSNLLSSLADAIQLELDAAGTNTKTEEVGHLTYTREEIEKSKELQNEIQITKAVYIEDAGEEEFEETENENEEAEETEETEEEDVIEETEENNDEKEDAKPGKHTKYPVLLPNYILNQAGYEEMMFSVKADELEIPVIRMDMCTLSRTDVDLVDIDFFSLNNDNANSFWNLVRQIVRLASRLVLTITAVLILTSLIWRSILLVSATISQTPERARKAKRKINSLLKSAGLIILVYFVMTFIFYIYRYISGLFIVDSESHFVLRLTLEGVATFNTSYVGYIKLLSLTTNGIARFFHVLLYLFVVLTNALWFIALLVRMLIIALCVIFAPLTAIMTTSTEAPGQEKEAKGVLHFYNWFIIYASMVFVPILIIIAERIITLMLSI